MNPSSVVIRKLLFQAACRYLKMRYGKKMLVTNKMLRRALEGRVHFGKGNSGVSGLLLYVVINIYKYTYVYQ